MVGVEDVLDHFRQHHGVDGAIGPRQQHLAEIAMPRVDAALAGGSHERGLAIHAGDAPPARGEQHAELPRRAADVEQATARLAVEKGEELADARLA